MGPNEAREPIVGDGYTVASLDGLGEGYGFRKIRRQLEVSEFGVNAIVLGGLAPVDAETVRSIRNRGPADAVYVVVGAEGGYVGRDGKLPDGEQGRSRPIDQG